MVVTRPKIEETMFSVHSRYFPAELFSNFQTLSCKTLGRILQELSGPGRILQETSESARNF